MKRIFGVICVVLLAVLGALCAAGCDGGKKSYEGTSDIDIGGFDYGFIKQEDYRENESTIADATKYTSLDADTIYYFLVDFTIASRRNNNGQSLLNVIVTFDKVNVLQGTMEEVGTGLSSEMNFTDADTGEDGKMSTVSFKIPADADGIKPIKMLVRLAPVRLGTSHISVVFESDDDAFYIYGADGMTRNLEIVTVILNTPAPKYDPDEMILTWNHVKNADYYKILVDREVLKDDENKEIIVYPGEFDAVGSPISFVDIMRYQQGRRGRTVQVQAYSNSANFRTSTPSAMLSLTTGEQM